MKNPPCIVTGGRADLHHIFSRGAYPELKDMEWNQIPLSRSLHQEVHSRGLMHMTEKYWQVKLFLESKGWTICEVKNKWTPPYHVKVSPKKKARSKKEVFRSKD